MNQRCNALIFNVQHHIFSVEVWLKMKVASIWLSMLFRRWNQNAVSGLIQGWYLVENENCVDICLSTLFQRWNEVALSILIYSYYNFISFIKFAFSVNPNSTLFQSYRMTLIERWFYVHWRRYFIATLSTLNQSWVFAGSLVLNSLYLMKTNR